MATSEIPHGLYPSESSSISSMATVSDQAGAGRTLYKGLRIAGGAVERRLNTLAARARRSRRRARTETAPPAPPAAEHARAGDDLHCVDAPSTMETVSDLTGAGRTLGLLYAAAGRRVEHHASSAASAVHKGPDAVARRIRERMPKCVPEDRRSFIIKQALRGSGRFVTDCRELVEYAASDVPSTRHRALEHVASFVISEPLLRSLFNQLHAIPTIRSYHPRAPVCCIDIRDGLLSCSRAALISLSEVEVNKVAKELMLRTQPVEENVYKLLKYTRHPELSFLALRHFQRSPEFIALTQSTLVEFAGILISHASFPEWDVVDGIILALLKTYIPAPSTPGPFENVHRALIKAMIWRADKLPRSLPKLIELTTFVGHPEACDNSEYALWPYLILSSFIPVRQGRLDVRKVGILRHMFPSDCLKPLWDNLSGPEIVLMMLLFERNAQFQKSSWTGIDIVMDCSELYEWCKYLSERIIAGPHAPDLRAVRTIELVVRLDRYCCKAMYEALCSTWASTQNHVFAEIVKDIWGISLRYPYPMPHMLKWPGQCRKDLLVFRHWSEEFGVFHVLPTRHIRQRPVCLRCARRDVCSECGVLSLCSHDVLLLDIHPGARFSTASHLPIIAWNANTRHNRPCLETEYLAFPQVADREIHYRASVKEGARTVCYWDDEGKLHESAYFYVPVLRWDVPDEVQQANDEEGTDSTGLYSWERCQWEPLHRRLRWK